MRNCHSEAQPKNLFFVALDKTRCFAPLSMTAKKALLEYRTNFLEQENL